MIRNILISKNKRGEERGFTLIETLVAITLLTVAIAAPMTLTSKSLAAAYYARDQITAFHLAQEAIEAVRHVRDHNILLVAQGGSYDILDGILPLGDLERTFTVDSLDNIENSIESCNPDDCLPLQIDPTGTFYGYGEGWEDSRFTRVVRVSTIPHEGTEVPQEVNVEVTVSWRTGAFQSRSVTISENLYRWVSDITTEEEEEEED